MEKRFLVARWLGRDTQPIPIYDEASVSTARQVVRDIGERSGASKMLTESVALIASELTHNQLAYARQGYFTVKAIERAGIKGLEVIAADVGPGLQRLLFSEAQRSAQQKSLGAGLEGVFRISDELDIDSRSDEGVCIIARKFEASGTGSWEIAIAGRPFPGEAISGDDAAFFQSDGNLLAIVADGLGHGPEAREASNLAMEIAGRSHQSDLGDLVTAVNTGLMASRGCALSIVRINENREVECIAAGDVHAHLYSGRDTHFFTSTPFVVGDAQFARRRLRVERQTAKPGSVLVMFTDGLQSKTSLKGELDLLRRPAIAIAQHLLATQARPNDDALVLVARLKK